MCQAWNSASLRLLRLAIPGVWQIVDGAGQQPY
jgi:hypothetical protein